MEKMTKKEMFEMIKGVCANDTRIVEFCEHEIELLNRKSSKIKGAIINALTEIAKPVTITEMQELNTEMANYSNQKLSALLKQLVESNQVVKTVEKKKSYFTVA